MASIPTLDGFNPLRGVPLDARTITTDRTSIAAGQVFQGMIVYDSSEDEGERLYVYNGTTGTNVATSWELIEGSGGGGAEISAENGDGTVLSTEISRIVAGNNINFTETTEDQIIINYDEDVTLNSITLTNLMFDGDREVANFVVTGDAGTAFNLAVVNTTPMGWLTSGALSATAGTIPADGTFEGTITIPLATEDVDRTAAITATAVSDASEVVSTGLFRQQHTAPVTNGNLTASSNSLVVGTMVTFSVNITAGDPDFDVELFDVDPRVMTGATSLQHAELTALGTHTFTAINTAVLDVGDHNYFIRVRDDDGDLVVEQETITIEGTSATLDWEGFTNYYLDGATLPYNVRGHSVVNATYSFNVYSEADQGGTLLETLSFTVTENSFDISDNLTTQFSNSWSLVRTDVSPNRVVEDGNTTLTTEDPTFSDLEVGFVISFTPTSTITSVIFSRNANLATNTVVNSIGIDWIEGTADTIPAQTGNNRIVSVSLFESAATGAYEVVNLSQGFSPGTYTIRPWIADATDLSTANITYGQVRTFTIT